MNFLVIVDLLGVAYEFGNFFTVRGNNLTINNALNSAGANCVGLGATCSGNN